LQGAKPLPEYQSLFGQSDLLFRPGPASKIVSLLIKAQAEAGCRLEIAEPSHRVISLLDASVVLF
jgi:hypothetical protein